MKRKITNIIAVFLIALLSIANFSYGIFTPYIYEAEDKSVIAYAELNAATISLPSGERIQSTNINGGTQMDIQQITSPVQLALVIDTSGSMIDLISKTNPITRMEQAKKVAISFVEKLFNMIENVKISVISFNSDAKLEVKNSSDKDAIINAINELTPRNSTKMFHALKLAKWVLSDKEQENTYSFLVNLTDGETESPDVCYKRLIEMQENNTKIYNVLLETDIIEAFSKNGVNAGTIYQNVSSEKLAEIYDEIYNNIRFEIEDNKKDSFI